MGERTAYGYVRKFLEEHNKTARNAEVNRLVKGITGIRRTTGQHPGGLMVLPKGREIYEFTPIQYPANDRESGVVTTHFEFQMIHDQLVKLDMLGHDGPTVIRMLEDLTGVPPLSIPLDDPDTMAIFSGLESLGIAERDAGGKVGTLGIPEYGTSFVRQMLEDTRPKTFADLVRIMGLSHGTDVWLNNAQDLVRSRTVTLSETIAARDDIMTYLIRKGLEPKTAFKIMEQVRKGRGLTPEDEAVMKEHQVPGWYIESCKKISYLFPKAHAVAYAMMAFYTAYYKVHHPLAFYATYFTIKVDDCDAGVLIRDAETLRKMVEDIERKGNDATAKEKVWPRCSRSPSKRRPEVSSSCRSTYINRRHASFKSSATRCCRLWRPCRASVFRPPRASLPQGKPASLPASKICGGARARRKPSSKRWLNTAV